MNVKTEILPFVLAYSKGEERIRKLVEKGIKKGVDASECAEFLANVKNMLENSIITGDMEKYKETLASVIVASGVPAVGLEDYLFDYMETCGDEMKKGYNAVRKLEEELRSPSKRKKKRGNEPEI